MTRVGLQIGLIQWNMIMVLMGELEICLRVPFYGQMDYYDNEIVIIIVMMYHCDNIALSFTDMVMSIKMLFIEM